MDLRFSDVTQPYYDEARIASELFTDFSVLPLSQHRMLIKLLFKSCRKELKRALRLRNNVSRQDLGHSLSALRRDFAGFMGLEEAPKPAAERAETLPSAVSDSELSLLKREP